LNGVVLIAMIVHNCIASETVNVQHVSRVCSKAVWRAIMDNRERRESRLSETAYGHSDKLTSIIRSHSANHTSPKRWFKQGVSREVFEYA
jgi:hypothetical protein